MRIYIHWPFCVSRCAYCDFNSRVAAAAVRSAYAGALRRELEIWSGLLTRGTGLRSVYLGGGTPSTMSGTEVAELLQLTKRLFGWRPDIEITVEVNPATWDRRDYLAARRGGVNRVSIGVQSLNDRCLKRLGRPHDAAETEAAVQHAHRAGMPSVSLDLLYGLPPDGERDFLQDLERALELRPHHMSLYALTLSPASRMGKSVARGETTLPGEDEVAEEYLDGVEILKAAGYRQYEISNFCLPGHTCRHNLGYWRREEYLGVGAGSHSLLDGCRFQNQESVLGYTRRLHRGVLPVCSCRKTEGAEARSERIMLGMRTARGVPERLLAGAGRLRDLERYGLLVREGGRVRLTERGMLLSNPVIIALLPA